MRGMKKHFNRIICLLAACLLLVTTVDMSVFASENNESSDVITANAENETENVETNESETDGTDINENKSDTNNTEISSADNNTENNNLKQENSDSSVVEIENIEPEASSSDGNITILEALEDIKENGVLPLGDENNKSTKKVGLTQNANGNENDVVEILQADENDDDADEDAIENIGEDEDSDSDDNDDATESKEHTYKKKGKRNYNIKLSGDVRARIVQYANSLGGYFESPYVRSGMTLAWQCCAYVNQVWWDVFGVDLYSISESAKNTYSEDGESAYEFFERVGVKSGDVIYTRYQKIKKNKRGGVLRDKDGNPVKTMGQHFVVVLDYDEDYIWYTDGYESRTRGFVVSSIDKKIKYSDSKYFRNVGGSYADIDGAYYARAGKSGTRFRYYRLPEYVWLRAGGDSYDSSRDGSVNAKGDASSVNSEKSAVANRLRSMAVLSATESTEVMGGVGDLWIAGLDVDGYEYNGGEITPNVEVYDKFKLVDPEEYVVEYTDNVDAGDATVWVTRITEPMGTISANFIIKPYDLEAHYNGENPDESDVTVKMPSGIKLRNLNSVKPLVTCVVSGNSISENTVDMDVEPSEDDIEADTIDIESDDEITHVRTLRLVNNKSYVVTYINEETGMCIDAASDDLYGENKKLTVLIEGTGNFTGTIAVTADVKAVPNQKSAKEKEVQVKKSRELSRKREIHNRLRNR